MSEPRLHHVSCLDARGLHRLAYWEWGDSSNPRVLLCVHGLLRQGRDFDSLARALCGHYRVICADMAGRGQSERLSDPMAYAVPTYVADVVTLVARLDAAQIDYLGTSMGGLIGMVLASLAGTPVRKLVLNDIGPAVDASGLARIAAYVGRVNHWRTVEEAADALLQISQGFGPHSREQWLALTRPQLRPDGDGFTSHHDPAIAEPIRAITPALASAGEAFMWQAYDRITAPTLVLRGAESDLLSAATAQAMALRGPRARVHAFDGVGHAPTLVQTGQQDVVRQFLLET